MNDTRYFISQIRLSGIKCIEKEIVLDFTTRNIRNPFSTERKNVKAIYGENGTGKSAVINAIKIYRNVKLSMNYLNQSETQNELCNLINKHSKSFEISIEYLRITGNTVEMRCIDQLSIGWNDISNRYEITEECTYQCDISTGRNLKILLKTKDGILQKDGLTEEQYSVLNEKTMNLLNMQSILPSYILAMKDKDDHSRHNGVYDTLMMNIRISIYTEQSDKHRMNTTMIGQLEKIQYSGTLDKNFFINTSMDRIPKSAYEGYVKKVQKMEGFIRLFKPTLKSIELKKTEDENAYFIDKLFVYPTCSVSMEYESTGIKKLVRLYNNIDALSKGSIVFIDEFDSNLNDIYLSKIIEYALDYCSGQLCFTTHNTSPMDVLQHCPRSIDFLSRDGFVIPWTRNGNYSARNLFTKGFIQRIPFNIEPESFLDAFGDSDDE